MGERGPAPTPTNILDIRGSWRAKTRTDEPVPDPTAPACPDWLRPEAKRGWKELVPQLQAMGVLGSCDRNALARYCQFYARWRTAEEFLGKHGETHMVRDQTGKFSQRVEYPEVQRTMRLADQLLKLEKQFGLTPSARAGLARPKDNPDENRGKGRFFKERG